MQIGLWLPVYGGWLRATGFDTEPSIRECITLAERAENRGYSLLYASENFLNCVHGPAHGVLDAWTLLAGVAARTETIKLIGALKPGFRPPLVAAQMVATVDQISHGRLGVNVVCGWWRQEFERCGVAWSGHDQKYELASRYLASMQASWACHVTSSVSDVPRRALAERCVLPVWVGGHSDAALRFAATHADVLFLNGMAPSDVPSIRARLAPLAKAKAPPKLAMNAFIVQDETDQLAQRRRSSLLERARPELISLYRAALREAGTTGWSSLGDDEFIDSNGGFATALVGSKDTLAQRIVEYEEAGIDILVCQFADMTVDAEVFGTSVLPQFADPRQSSSASAIPETTS